MTGSRARVIVVVVAVVGGEAMPRGRAGSRRRIPRGASRRDRDARGHHRRRRRQIVKIRILGRIVKDVLLCTVFIFKDCYNVITCRMCSPAGGLDMLVFPSRGGNFAFPKQRAPIEYDVITPTHYRAQMGLCQPMRQRDFGFFSGDHFFRRLDVDRVFVVSKSSTIFNYCTRKLYSRCTCFSIAITHRGWWSVGGSIRRVT